MILHWLITTLYLLLFLFLLKKSRFLNDSSLPFQLLAGAFVVKVVTGILYGYVDAYAGSKGGDSMNYFWDANWIFQAFHENPKAYFQMLTGIHDGSKEIYTNYYHYLITWKVNDYDYFFNDSRTIVRLHAFIRLFSFGVYNVHVIVFTFLSFAGQLMLYKTMKKHLATGGTLFFILLCFLPSSLVWLSGSMKEPLLMLGLGAFVWNLDKAAVKPQLKNSAALAGAILCMLLIRFTLLLCLAPGVVLFIWQTKHAARPWLKTGMAALASLILLFGMEYMAEEYKISRILYDQLMNVVKTIEYYHPEIKVQHLPLQDNLVSVLSLSPAAFLKTLAAPVKQALTNPYRLLFFAENMSLLILAILTMIRFRKPSAGALPLLLFSISLIALLYVLIGLTSPFEMTIVRYRSVAMPFLLFVLFSFRRTDAQVSEKKFTS